MFSVSLLPVNSRKTMLIFIAFSTCTHTHFILHTFLNITIIIHFQNFTHYLLLICIFQTFSTNPNFGKKKCNYHDLWRYLCDSLRAALSTVNGFPNSCEIVVSRIKKLHTDKVSDRTISFKCNELLQKVTISSELGKPTTVDNTSLRKKTLVSQPSYIFGTYSHTKKFCSLCDISCDKNFQFHSQDVLCSLIKYLNANVSQFTD